MGAVPKVGEHVDAARLDFGRLGILVLVDHVLVDGEVHDLVDLGLLPCLAEGGQVLAGVSVQEELVLNHLEDVRGQAFLLGELVFRQRLREGPAGEDRIQKRIANVVLVTESHGNPSREPVRPGVEPPPAPGERRRPSHLKVT